MGGRAEQTEKLAGPIALLKLKQTRAATLVSDEACQIFGGRAVTRTGMGQQVERFQRTFKFHSILGGSEEIMADLGVRQALKYWDLKAKLSVMFWARKDSVSSFRRLTRGWHILPVLLY